MTDEQPVPGTWIEINQTALRHNLTALQERFAPAEMCMVVKGNAYGHGYEAIVPLAEEAGIRQFAVFSGREAAGFLRASDGGSTLQVMGHADHRNLPWMVRRNMQPWLNDLDDWEALLEVLDECEQEVRVHLEVETGMNRTGLPPAQAFEVAQAIHENPQLVLEGVCTHLAGLEQGRNQPRIRRQRRVFQEFLDALEADGIRPNKRHMASSLAALDDPRTRLDMVRVGIASYGLWPSPESYRQNRDSDDPLELRPVLRWRSQVMALKPVVDGDYVGYGTTYQAEGPIRIAVVPVGYADGFARDLSNRGHVLIGGKRCSIIGNVNMNMVQAHVSHVPDLACGDEVILIGDQGDESISVASFSDFNNVVNYELMSRLSWEIPRFIVDD